MHRAIPVPDPTASRVVRTGATSDRNTHKLNSKMRLIGDNCSPRIYTTLSNRQLIFMMLFLTLTLFVSVKLTVSFRSVDVHHAQQRLKPLHENFYTGIGEDPAKNAPPELLTERKYQDFVRSYKPDAMILNPEPKYDVLNRIRELRLLSLTADSGLLEVLGVKGLSLSQVEGLLAAADTVGLLPLVVKNQKLLLSVAPLVIEPAPALLPLVVTALRTNPQTFLQAGAASFAASLGLYEVNHDLAAVSVAVTLLFSVPLAGLGTALGKGLPAVSSAPKALKAAAISTASKVTNKVTDANLPRLTSIGVERVKDVVRPAAKSASQNLASVTASVANSARSRSSQLLQAADNSGGTRRRPTIVLNNVR